MILKGIMCRISNSFYLLQLISAGILWIITIPAMKSQVFPFRILSLFPEGAAVIRISTVRSCNLYALFPTSPVDCSLIAAVL